MLCILKIENIIVGENKTNLEDLNIDEAGEEDKYSVILSTRR